MSDPLAPLRVKSASQKALLDSTDWASKALVWVPDPKDGFVQAKLESTSGDSCQVFREDTRQSVKVAKDDVQKMNPPKFNMIEDMANLAVLNEASVLFNLRERYFNNLIYTYSGLFCVVVNPYKALPIYGDAIVQLYKGEKRDSLPPHVFAVADEAYRNMLQDREDQSILCTGESGAGKTENTKKVIQYLASVAAGGRARATRTATDAAKRRRSSIGLSREAGLQKGELEQQLLQANPILETFGNASTVKNDNSSRFGKFIRIHFDNAGYIIGATINTYLLEKSRAVLQNEGERNFHAFYQLCRGASREDAAEMLLGDVASYKYITGGDRKLPLVDDAKEYAATNAAFKIMGLGDDEIRSIWRVVSAVLQFGQLSVEQDKRSEQAIMRDDSAAQKLCRLLGINAADFTRCLLKPRVKAGNDMVAKQQTKEQVDFAVEALAKALYERLFLWIVRKVNDVLSKTSRDSRSFIGILDIAGFEIFKVNSFEQLCINYTNEKLQQLFNHKMFILEQEEYKKENIDWTFVDFGLDLQPTIELIEKQGGVLALLDEQCFFPKATDKTLVEKFAEQLSKNPKFEKAGFRGDGDFAIQHYAGKVAYNANQWLIKNRDPLNDNVTALLEEATEKLVKDLWTQELVVVSGSTRRGTFRTVGHIYKDQLAQLMDTLNCTNPNFVRCIIPNHKKKSDLIDAPLVLDQLRCNGVLEGIRICRTGFPNRVLFAEFRQRYSLLCPEVVPASIYDSRVAVEKMAVALGIDQAVYRIGVTKIFFRTGVLHELEENRDKKLSKMIIGLQAHCRGYLARRLFGHIIHGSNAITVIQRNARAYLQLRSWPWWKLFTKVKPLLKVARGDEELRLLREELEQWKEKAQKEEALRLEAEKALDQLTEEKRRLAEEFQAESMALAEAEEIRSRLSTRKQELEEELNKMETDLDEQVETNSKLLVEKKDLVAQLDDLKKDLETSNQNESRINRLDHQLTETKQKLERQIGEFQDLEESKKKLAKDIQTLQEQLDEAAASKAKAEKARAKLQSEVEDLTVNLDRERQLSASFTTKQRGFDKQLQEVRTTVETSTQERDAAQAEVRALQTKVLSLKSEMDNVVERADSAEKAKKRLQAELDEVMDSKQDKNLAEIEAAKRQLQVIVDEQKQQIIELEDQVQLTEDAKLRLEVNLHALQEQLESKGAVDAEEEENKRRALQRQVKELEEEVENERRNRGKLANEKRKLELDLKGVQEQLEEETRQHQRDITAMKKLEKKLSVFYSERMEEGAVGEATSKEMEKLRQKIRQLKSEINEAEDTIAKANAARRRAERELEENHEMTSTYEAEIAQLRSQLRRVRAVKDEVDNPDSPPKAGYTVHTSYTETTTTTSKKAVDDTDA